MTRFCNIVFSDSGMLLMYLIAGTCYSEEKFKWNGIVYHVYINLQKRNYFNCL